MSGTQQMPRPDIDEVEFPDVMPPFGRSAVRVTGDGEVWVRRQQPSSASTVLYDVFDGDGELARRVAFTGRRSVVGFGDGVVYVTATDEDDLQWLERYPR